MSEPPEATTHVEVRGLTVVQAGETLLEDVDLEVARGDLHALVGPNGGGKTTLVRALLGAVEFQGSVRFHWSGNGHLGYVPQSVAFDRSLPLTVADFLALTQRRWPVCLGRRPRPQLAAEAELALEPLLSRPLSRLSGGERQRVLLGAALVPDPELLILDEPAAALDRDARRRIRTVLAARQAQGQTTLLVSHDLDLVADLATQVTILARRVRNQGPPAEVLPQGAGAWWEGDGP